MVQRKYYFDIEPVLSLYTKSDPGISGSSLKVVKVTPCSGYQHISNLITLTITLPEEWDYPNDKGNDTP